MILRITTKERRTRRAVLALLFFIFCSIPAHAFEPQFKISEDDSAKSVEQLLQEALMLFTEEKPLEARTKLLTALEKDPKKAEAHMWLGHYYNYHVGHYRLAVKYIKKAEQLLKDKSGEPPFYDPIVSATHSRILHLLADVRLNLDNYDGALKTLDRFSKNYFAEWYPGTRAWVLMKIGKVKEAISVARRGLLAGAEFGRTYNILGILLSLNKDRQESIKIFNKAIAYESSLGSFGQPATPLNNVGEVYREIFMEDKAEASWSRALRMPDGCEHVLPSMNMAVLLNEQLRISDAYRAMDQFEQCTAQFPLRNGEEHRALVHLSRGRSLLAAGHADPAIEHFEKALERQQWFGKIGTDQDDLRVGALFSLAYALKIKRAHIRSTPNRSFLQKIKDLKELSKLSLRQWWLIRRARQIAMEDLNGFEDLFVRHTDSMIEYHTLGAGLVNIPSSAIQRKIEDLLTYDKRKQAHSYYKAYLAEWMIQNGEELKGATLARKTLQTLRSDSSDAGIRAHTLGLYASIQKTSSQNYKKSVIEIFRLNRALVRNYELQLPIKFIDIPSKLKQELISGSLIEDTNSPISLVLNQTNQVIVYDQNRKLLQIELPKENEAKVQAITNKLFSLPIIQPEK